jgi:hypothetical protein
MAYEYKPKNDGQQMTAEEKAKIKNWMMETSEKPAEIPRRLYHATSVNNLHSILEQGLKPHEIFGEIYFCEKEKQCTQFIKPPCIVIAVDTNKLDKDFLFLSADHTKIAGRNFDAFTYYNTIEPNNLQWRFING